MTEMRASLIARLRGNVGRTARRWSGDFNRFGNSADRNMARADRRAKLMGRSIGLANRNLRGLIAGMTAGMALRSAGRHTIAWELRLARLGVQANKSKKEIAALRREIFQTARDPNIKVDPGEITSAIENIVEMTGDLPFAQRNIRAIAMAIQATGATGQDIGLLVSEFKKFGVEGKKAVLMALNTLTVQGKKGSFTLRNLARMGSRLASAYAAVGDNPKRGLRSLREIGAIMQMVRSSTGNAEQATTAFEATLRTLQDPAKLKKLEQAFGKNRLGLLYEPEQLKKGKKVLRDIPTLLENITKVAKGDPLKLGQVFDAEAMRAMNAFVVAFKNSGGFEAFRKFLDVKVKGDELQQDSARIAQTSAANVQNLRTKWQDFATGIEGPMGQALAFIQEFSGELVIAGVALGGVVAGIKTIGRLRKAMSPQAGKTVARGPGPMGVTPVRIVGQPVWVTQTRPTGRRGAARRSPRNGPAKGAAKTAAKRSTATGAVARSIGGLVLGGVLLDMAFNSKEMKQRMAATRDPRDKPGSRRGAVSGLTRAQIVEREREMIRLNREAAQDRKAYAGFTRQVESADKPDLNPVNLLMQGLGKGLDLLTSAKTQDAAAQTMKAAADAFRDSRVKVDVGVTVAGPAGTATKLNTAKTGKIDLSTSVGRQMSPAP